MAETKTPYGFDLQAARRMFEDDLASNTLGIRLVEVDLGIATVTMTVSETMLNAHAIGHGGYVFLLADTAFACACNTYGPVTVAQGAEISFLAPVHAGDDLIAVAVERAKAGRSGIYDVTVTSQTGVVAEFRGRSREIS